MRTPAHLIAAVRAALVAVALLLAPAAHAQVPAKADSGLLVIFQGLTPVAHERYTYQVDGDSIMVTAVHRRQVVDDQQSKHTFEKSMLLVVDARDLGLRRYLSNQHFRDRAVTRGLIVTDTVFTYYTEVDGVGDATRIALPPGRMFVFDSALFTLFDVICRSLKGKEFETRRMQLAEMSPDSLLLPMATITQARADTLAIEGRRVPVRRYRLDDAGVQFDLWADRDGRMMQMRHEESGLRVERVVEPKPVAKPRRTGTPKR
jgi:hypothetical protein